MKSHKQYYFCRKPEWTQDETMLSKINNTDVVFYEKNNFEKIVHRINCLKVFSYSISVHTEQYFVITFTLGSKGIPARVWYVF